MLLEKTDPDIAAPLAEVDPAAMRAFTRTLLSYVFAQVPIHVADDVLASLSRGAYGPSALREALKAAAAEAKGQCLDLEERLDEDDLDDAVRSALGARWKAESRVSAAFDASYAALHPDPAEAVGEAVYAAFWAISTQEVIDLLYTQLGIVPRGTRDPFSPPRRPTGYEA